MEKYFLAVGFSNSSKPLPIHVTNNIFTPHLFTSTSAVCSAGVSVTVMSPQQEIYANRVVKPIVSGVFQAKSMHTLFSRVLTMTASEIRKEMIIGAGWRDVCMGITPRCKPASRALHGYF